MAAVPMALVAQALNITGVLTISYLLLKGCQFVHTFLRRSSLSRYHHGSQACWALVTGSTDGIGLAFAHQLASGGFSIILHGRNIAKLEGVKADLEEAYPSVQFRLFVADARNVAAFEKSGLAEIISGLRVTVLINNVGIGHTTLDANEIDDVINTNVRFTVQLTSYLLPTLVANGPALILNMGSNAEVGIPWLSVYAGTKAFLMSWGKALAAEMNAEGHDVEVRGIKIGEVNTRVRAPAADRLSVPSPRVLARTALERVGGGPRVVSAYWVHALERGFLDMLPDWVQEKGLIHIARERRAGWSRRKMD